LVIQASVPAGPLTPALNQYAAQSGLQILFDANLAAGRHTQGARGNLTPHQALSQLLAGTGLAYRFTNSRTVSLYRLNTSERGAVNAPADAVTLDEISVQGLAPWQSPSGFTATRSEAGTKTDTPLVETPQAISVVTRDQMTVRNIQSVTQALDYTSGVWSGLGGNDPRFDWIMLRGFREYIYGDFRDGLRQATGANNFTLFRTEPYGLERIDVIKGSSSALYGQNAPGGLVDRISKRPVFAPFGEVGVSRGNFNRTNACFDFGGTVLANDQFAYRLTGLVRDGQTTYKNGEDDRVFIAPAFTWKPDEDTSLTFLSQYQYDRTRASFLAVRQQNGIYYPTNVFLGDPTFDRFSVNQFQVGYIFNHRFNEAVSVEQRLRYGHVTVDYAYLTQGGLPSGAAQTVARISRNVRETMGTFAVDNNIKGQFNTGPLAHTALFGIDYQRLNIDSFVYQGLGPTLSLVNPIYYQGVTQPTMLATNQALGMDQLGFYLQDQIKLDGWRLILSGRHDQANLTTTDRLRSIVTPQHDKALTGRAALLYAFDNGISPYVSFSTTFVPTAGTDYYGTPFVPSTGRQKEAGIKYQPPGMNMLFTMAAFEIHQQNVTTADPAHVNYNVQTGEVRSRGIEAEANYTLSDELNLTANFTYQDVRVTKSNGTDLGHFYIATPRMMAGIYGDYTFRTGVLSGFGFGGGFRYQGQTYGDNTSVLINPAHYLVDATLHYEYQGFRFSVTASNLFDQNTTTCISGSCVFDQRRSVIGTLTYKF
jgi:iron complex outermembrane receptor protein